MSTIKNMLNFFLKLGKKYGVQNHICKVIFDEREIYGSTIIKIYSYYESPLRKRSSKSKNNSLTMEFYKTFWIDLKEPYIISIKQAFQEKAF